MILTNHHMAWIVSQLFPSGDSHLQDDCHLIDSFDERYTQRVADGLIRQRPYGIDRALIGTENPDEDEGKDAEYGQS